MTKEIKLIIPDMYQLEKKFTFIDLFAGIGGLRIAFDSVGGECIFSSEWNKFSQQTYKANFGDMPEGDITEIDEKDIPDHDILVGGFPCQPFSIAGVSSNNSLGREHGFNDKTRGTLFFDVCRIIKEKKPKAFLLENVKNLKSHDKGNTFKVILNALQNELGYDIHYKVIDASSVVPQHRERIFIVGFRKTQEFEFPELTNIRPILNDILENNVDEKYTLKDGTWNALQKHRAKHKAKGNGFGYSKADPNGITKTLSARYYKDGAEILIDQGKKNPRRLTPNECKRLMGFPEKFKVPVSDNQAYRQFGNAVVVPVVKTIAKEIVKCLIKENKKIIVRSIVKTNG
jgi:DNA (cytosine-5)-methyltransferase 1